MKIRIRAAVILCIISTLMLTGFTCSKQVPVNEPKTATEEAAPTESVPQDQMTTEPTTPTESNPSTSTQ